MPQARRRTEDDDLPDHEQVREEPEDQPHDGGGVDIDLDTLPKDKKEEERQTRKGGEAREDGGLERAQETDEREDVRVRRRQERKDRKEDARRRETELKSRLETAERELAEVKTRQAQGEVQDVRESVSRIEGEMETLQRQYNEAKALKEKAYNDKDGKAAVEADEAMTAARERYNSLGGRREQIIANVEQSRRQPRVSQQLAQHAKSFMDEHDWYDAKGGDRDSAKVLSLDRKMAAEGWDPNTAGYWEELRERVKEDLPHRFDDEDRREEDTRTRREEREQPRRRQTTGGSGREAGGRSGGNSFYLSAARVSALKEAGMWDDEAKRAKMIRTYKERDDKERREKERR